MVSLSRLHQLDRLLAQHQDHRAGAGGPTYSRSLIEEEYQSLNDQLIAEISAFHRRQMAEYDRFAQEHGIPISVDVRYHLLAGG